MNQIRRTLRFALVSPFFESLRGARFSVLLARKNQNDITPLISQRHPVGERILTSGPANVHTEPFIAPFAAHVKGLVTHCPEHRLELCFRPLARLPCY